MQCNAGWKDGWSRFQSWNQSDPSVVRGYQGHYCYNYLFRKEKWNKIKYRQIIYTMFCIFNFRIWAAFVQPCEDFSRCFEQHDNHVKQREREREKSDLYFSFLIYFIIFSPILQHALCIIELWAALLIRKPSHVIACCMKVLEGLPCLCVTPKHSTILGLLSFLPSDLHQTEEYRRMLSCCLSPTSELSCKKKNKSASSLLLGTSYKKT